MTSFIDVARDQIDEARRSQSELEARRHDLSRPPTDLYRLVEIGERYEAAYQSVGAGGTPDPLSNESAFSYRRRLAGHLKHFSKEWSGSDLYRLPRDVMDVAEREIIEATAVAVADKTRGDPRTGGLREIKTTDHSGREITDFAGNPLVWLNQFMGPAKAVKRFRNPATGATLRVNRRSI